MGKKVLVTWGPAGRPYQPELDEAEATRKGIRELRGHRLKCRTFHYKGNGLRREFWAVPIQVDSPPGEGKSHAARARRALQQKRK